jgi:hypothetical protein
VFSLPLTDTPTLEKHGESGTHGGVMLAVVSREDGASSVQHNKLRFLTCGPS